MDRIKTHFTDAARVLEEFVSNSNNLEAIARAGDAMVHAIKSGGKIISCGNGGSHCDAMHFAEELTGRYRQNRAALPAICISDASHISCVGNDYGFDYIFSRFIEGLGKKGDCLLAISTSGNSSNILKATEVAKNLGITVIGLSGKDGGKLAASCDIEIRAPYSEFADRAQEIHIKVIHALIDHIEQNL